MSGRLRISRQFRLDKQETNLKRFFNNPAPRVWMSGKNFTYIMKKSVVNGTEASIIMGCAKSNVINISDRLGWEYERRGNSKYYRLSDVCGYAGCTQKEGLRRVAELRASKGQPSDVKIEFPGVAK